MFLFCFASFEIIAEQNTPDNVYIQSALLNGQPLNRAWFLHQTLSQGGQLQLTLGAYPNKDWGSRPEDAPPSMSTLLI